MSNKKEDREFELGLARIHIFSRLFGSAFTTLLAVIFSMWVSYMSLALHGILDLAIMSYLHSIFLVLAVVDLIFLYVVYDTCVEKLRKLKGSIEESKET